MPSSSQSEMGELFCQIGNKLQSIDLDLSKEFFGKVLEFDPSCTEAVTILAEMAITENNSIECQRRCEQLISIEPQNTKAQILLADCMYQRGEHEKAILHFSSMLEQNPENTELLYRLVETLRRLGKLNKAERFISLVKEKVGQSAAIHYFEGILNRYYKNQLEKALESYNQARHAPRWMHAATVSMIEIYLNPSNESLFHQTNSANKIDSNGESLVKLVNELSRMIGAHDPQVLVYRVYILMTKRNF